MTLEATVQTLEFFHDIGSPYSYIAAAQVEDVAAQSGLVLRWRPMLLGAVFRAAGNVSPAAGSPAKARYLVADLTRLAAHAGIPFAMPARFPANTLLAMRALTAAGMSPTDGERRQVDATRALFAAYWVRGLDISAPEVVAEVISAEAVAAAGTDAVKEALRATTDEAVRRGAFGAPTFFVGDDMYLGGDRLFLIRDRDRR
jgi:2-hydroxychromene-2-carboxylate isomerase